MNSFDFDYYKPSTVTEAYDCYQDLIRNNKTPLYYAGGTEIISMARTESIKFNAVIDIKGIPECSQMEDKKGKFILGGCLTLTQIAEADFFPLFSETVSRIADHTIQDKITLGGNIAGTILYREASLPLMLTKCSAVVMTANGPTEVPFLEIFKGSLKIKRGEFLVQFIVNSRYFKLPYVHVKKTKNEKIDYPLMTLCGIKESNGVSAAVSGLANVPVLLPTALLNQPDSSAAERIGRLITYLEPSIMNDLSGSKEYRKFVFENVLYQMYDNFEED